MNDSFEYITFLQYRVKTLRDELKDFQSGAVYVKMCKSQQKRVRYYENLIKGLRKELELTQRTIVRIREQWYEVFQDMEKEKEALRLDYEKRLKKAEERAEKVETRLAEEQEKTKEQRIRIYELETDLEEANGKNKKLTAQLNRDYENSSLPSSMTVKKKKISNSREKTGRKPGGQPGHKGYGRKKQTPTEPVILLPPPQEVSDDPGFKKTGKTIVKQQIGIQLNLVVKEYHADVYYNSKTGERIHAHFPEGVVDDVNYDGSIKAFLFLLNNDCCTSIDKSRKFLSDLTAGKLNISKGMINGLCREFSAKTEQEQKALFQRLQMSPVMHVDCTNGREDGKNIQIFVCATPKGETMYFAREKKGHEGVKGTPVEDYQGILVHDHESTFFHYGSDHQECLAHILRYLKDSMENEPERTWNKEMYSLIREIIHYWKNNSVLDTETVLGFEKRYREVLEKAEKEYEYEPASQYYRSGYNLYLRMNKKMEHYLLFLHDDRVPDTNNEAERHLRSYKRKQKQAVSFRSIEAVDYLCKSMSMLVMMREKNENIYDRVSQIFG